MSIPTKLHAFSALMGLALFASVSSAHAAESLTVLADQSRIIRLDRAPGTVVVGNPSIVDVTIQGNQLFLHGRAFGKTNVMVLDDGGNALAEYNVNVGLEDDYSAVVFKGSPGGVLRSTYTCKGDCEVVLHIGDDKDAFKVVHEQHKNKLGIAQDQKPGEEDTDGGNGQNDPSQ
ncbi:pilus assembly protein N-terminal domain-containing protein [Aestuariivirga sp.]|uniref:pilus assembly protein N-terminal domain-containing protein n=1 Tax=Aestuariivirga sp. TaxID=2650926 RepID=UPI00359476D7